ncbi:hypothetical protein [Sneathia sanguinegens]|jgi:hypothetical protein|uniref:hypothetical protein n=1 Tax=Sneathia sanguinegens TaxID=40543 RepID=UPI0023FA2648|nr:hypothetical protein [Sneathia sanguinegens]
MLNKKINNLKTFENNNETDNRRLSVSFEIITTNSKFNFNYFSSKMIRDKAKAYDELHRLLAEISNSYFKKLMNKIKNKGLEKLEDINFKPCKQLYNDENIYVMRFNQQKYRLIFILRDNIVYIIGFDFNYSAYNHG